MRVKTRWSGFTGGPGYTVMHFREFSGDTGAGTGVSQEQAAAAVERVRAFWAAVRVTIAAPVLLNIEGDVDVLEDTTGELVDSYSVTPPAEQGGSAAGVYSAASGAVVNWRTNGIRNGRKIRGRSFLVPLGASSQTATGVLNASVRSTIVTAAAALAAGTGSPDLGVYARPTSPGAADGQWSAVTGSNVPTMLAILRSRRD